MEIFKFVRECIHLIGKKHIARLVLRCVCGGLVLEHSKAELADEDCGCVFLLNEKA